MTEDGRANRRRLGAIVAYAGAAALSIVAAIFLLELPRADLRVPFDYGGDAFLYSAVVKSILEHGWFWTNASVGAPGVLQLYDYPNVAHESIHLLIVKAMSLFSHDWGLLINLYFLLGFPLITLTAMAVFRRFRVGWGPAMAGGILYAFLPTRLIKGEAHIFLDVFFQVPLAVMLLLWVCGDDPPVAPGPRVQAGDHPVADAARRAHRRRTLAALGICVLNAGTSSYFSFFMICLLVAGGLWASFERRSPRNLVAGVALAAVTLGTMAAFGLPSIVYHLRHGTNREVGQREPREAEYYGMKISHLLLPVDGHRVTALSRLKERYSSVAPLNNENGSTSLGFVGGIGFVALMGALLSRRRAAQHDVVRSLAMLNLTAVFIGTIGGLGALFAFLIDPQIRTYSRIAVFIGFFALFAAMLLLDWLLRRRPRAGLVALPVVLLWGLLDQASLQAARPYESNKGWFKSDRDLVRRIEDRVPAGAAIFVLPYVSFPESAPVRGLTANDQLRTYLHATRTRWSFPTMRARNGDRFARDTSAQAPAEMLRTLVAAGFDGVLIHRDGFADDGTGTEQALTAAVGVAPLVSQNGRLSFIDLTAYRRRTPVDRSPEEIARLTHPVAATFGSGFDGLEHNSEHDFRWCGHQGVLHLNNDLGVIRRLSLKMVVLPAHWPARLHLGGDLITTTLTLDGALSFDQVLELPPGHHQIRFSSTGRPADVPSDPRTMVWRMEDFVLTELPPTPVPAP
jgi:phosphoglycerol transferase